MTMTRVELPRAARIRSGGSALLRLYAGCLFSGSSWAGACLLAATLLAPFSALLGLLSVGSALLTARALGLLSARNPAPVFTYSALFLGLIAGRTFEHSAAALTLATLGAAASTLLTASLRELGARFGLPALSLPFVVVYLCALGTGRMLGLSWAPLPVLSDSFAAWLPELVRLYLEALGALVCDGRAEVGLLVLAALLLAHRHAAPLTTLGFAIALAVSHMLDLTPLLRLVLLLNAMFTALALGAGWFVPSLRAYALSALGALICALCTPSLAAPFGRVELTALSLPFNLSIFAVILVRRQRAQQADAQVRTEAQRHSVIAMGTMH